MIPIGMSPRELAIMGIAVGFLAHKFENAGDKDVVEAREALPEGVDQSEVFITSLKLAGIYMEMLDAMKAQGKHLSETNSDNQVADFRELPEDVLNTLRTLERQFND